MGVLRNIIRISALLLVLLTMRSSHAEMNHTNKQILIVPEGKIKEKTMYDPLTPSKDVVTVSFIERKNLKFDIGIGENSDNKALFQSQTRDNIQDDVELKAGLTYTDPVHSKAKFYFNYSMMGSANRLPLRNDSSEEQYYIDQQAKMGVKIAF